MTITFDHNDRAIMAQALTDLDILATKANIDKVETHIRAAFIQQLTEEAEYMANELEFDEESEAE